MTYHPVSTFFRLLALNIHLHFRCHIVLLCLQCLGQFSQSLDSVRFQKLPVVEVIEQEVQSLLCVLDLGMERRGRLGCNTLHIAAKDFYHQLGRGWDL